MQMLAEILAPSVEHHRDPDSAPEPLGIPTEGLQGVRGRLKQEVVDRLRISLGERVDRMGQGEDQMEIGHRQDSAVRASTQRSLASVWHFGQWRLRQE